MPLCPGIELCDPTFSLKCRQPLVVNLDKILPEFQPSLKNFMFSKS